MQAPAEGATGLTTLASPDLSRLSSQFAQLANAAEFLRLSISLINAAGGILFHAGKDGLDCIDELISRQALSWSPNLRHELAASAHTAMQEGRVHYQRLESALGVWFISCPFFLPGQQPACLSVIILIDSNPLEPFLVITQLLASLLASQARAFIPVSPAAGDRLRALLPLLATTLAAEKNPENLLLLNVSLKQWATCSQVAIGTIDSSGRMRLRSLSHVTTIDSRTDHARILEKALQECASQRTQLTWPALRGTTPVSPILQEAAELTRTKQGLAVPLSLNSESTPVGTLIFLWDAATDRSELASLMNTAGPLLAIALTQKHAPQGFLSDGLGAKAGSGPLGLHRRAWFLIGAVAITLVGLVPIPFRISAEALVQPESTHYIAARFDGLLKEAMVRPGDHVHQGDTLGQLDGREIELQLASLGAEKDKASKMRDQFMAAGDTAAAQIARLDELRFAGQLKLLQEKLKALTLVSPVNGIVLTGDLKRIEGSPISKGQTLFEVAPLDNMDIELAIRENDIAYASAGMVVTIRVAAYPDTVWQGTIASIVPKSQLRENKNVFIARVAQKNPEYKLHPGMRGEAKIRSGWRALGWQLFRKPWYTIVRLIEQVF